MADVIEKTGTVFPLHRIITEIERMRTDGLILTNSEHLQPDTKIKILGLRGPTEPEPS